MSTEVFPSTYPETHPHQNEAVLYTVEQIREYNLAVNESIEAGNPTWLYSNPVRKEAAHLYFNHLLVGWINLERDGTYTGAIADYENIFAPQLTLHDKTEEEAKSFVASGMQRYVEPGSIVPDAVTISFPVRS